MKPAWQTRKRVTPGELHYVLKAYEAGGLDTSLTEGGMYCILFLLNWGKPIKERYIGPCGCMTYGSRKEVDETPRSKAVAEVIAGFESTFGLGLLIACLRNETYEHQTPIQLYKTVKWLKEKGWLGEE